MAVNRVPSQYRFWRRSLPSDAQAGRSASMWVASQTTAATESSQSSGDTVTSLSNARRASRSLTYGGIRSRRNSSIGIGSDGSANILAARSNAPSTIGSEDKDDDGLCFGMQCYAPTFWAMAVSTWIACGLWLFAWRGPGGWKSRGIVV